jgi:hypothetical protein
MKLLKLLTNVVLETQSPKIFISEVSEKVKKQLLTKFLPTTTDSEETILAVIDLFDRYKTGLAQDKRDIMKYSYEELKSLISSKESAKTLDDIFTEFKKKESKLENNSLKRYIKKFLEIQSELPEKKKDILKYKFLDLVKLVDDVYPKLISKKLWTKFSKENPNLTKDQILFYVGIYLDNFDLIPFTTKGADKMSFSEFEHLLDGITANTSKEKSKTVDISDIELKYDENNLKIFAPLTKDQCIKLRNGRSWCTSREGSGNMYYNYRLDNERTLYYVIDEDKPFDDLNFAVVVLVDPRGGMSLADGSNSGKYSGHSNIPWNDIVSKVPKLKGLEHIFVPKPLTSEEKDLIRRVKSVRVGDDPIKSFNDDVDMTELWLEVTSPRLNDTQYSNLTPNLKKKYIALGLDLSSGMVQNSEPEVLKYYISKKIDSLKTTNVRNLSQADIALLRTPMLKQLREELRPTFMSQVTSSGGEKLEIEFPNSSEAKIIALYGFNSFFSSLPNNLKSFVFSNKSNDSLNLDIPSDISKFKNLEALLLMNCVRTLPDEMGQLKNLTFLSLPDNSNLIELPSSILELPALMFINLKNSNPKLPEGFEKHFQSEGGSPFYSKVF